MLNPIEKFKVAFLQILFHLILMLTLNPPWSASLADQSGIGFSLWDYFWFSIVGKED